MPYTKTIWKDGDAITVDKLNNLENGVANEQVGPKGDKGDIGPKGAKGITGPAGKSIKSLALTTTDGKVTGGTLTFDDDTTTAVTVTEA